MTFERRIVTGIEDIKAIIFECKKCNMRICRSPDRIGDIPFSCECGHVWRSSSSPQGGIVEPSAVQFVKAVPTLRMVGKENPFGFRILFEFEEPNAK